LLLRIDRSWIDCVRDWAGAYRYGGTRLMPEADRVMAIEHARKVVDRFCMYLRGGQKPLTATDCDTLTEP
jgi:hypothetical protein